MAAAWAMPGGLAAADDDGVAFGAGVAEDGGAAAEVAVDEGVADLPVHERGYSALRRSGGEARRAARWTASRAAESGRWWA